MITKQDLKDYEFENINGLFEYVLESIPNGQIKQARELIAKMSPRQRGWFLQFIDDCYYPVDIVLEAQKMVYDEKD
jgi:hypothetical protein